MKPLVHLPIAVVLLAAASCTPVSALLERPAVHEIRVPVTRSDARDEFTAQLELRAASGELVKAVHPSGTLKLNWRDDDVLEYDLKLSDCEGIHFTTAQIVRRTDDGVPGVVATLFTDMLLTGPHVQMRGTGSVARGVRLGTLAEEIQERPGAFVVRVTSQADDSVVLEGVLR